MSRPRTPFGSSLPGRLPATMIKVLAAEMSDQQRLARGKRYHADAAVIDIVIGHGVLTAEVQGSRPDPYVVTIEADGGEGVPSRREIWAQCTCPDDDGTGTTLCKHGVAAMFALSDEVSIEPELLERWRTSRRRPRDSNVTELPTPTPMPDDMSDSDDSDDPDDPDDAPSATVIPIRRGVADSSERVVDRRPVDDGGGGLSAMLAALGGAPPPEFPEIDHVDHRSLRDELLRTVLDDALDHLTLRWE
jgi:hypothetical protein